MKNFCLKIKGAAWTQIRAVAQLAKNGRTSNSRRFFVRKQTTILKFCIFFTVLSITGKAAEKPVAQTVQQLEVAKHAQNNYLEDLTHPSDGRIAEKNAQWDAEVAKRKDKLNPTPEEQEKEKKLSKELAELIGQKSAIENAIQTIDKEIAQRQAHDTFPERSQAAIKELRTAEQQRAEQVKNQADPIDVSNKPQERIDNARQVLEDLTQEAKQFTEPANQARKEVGEALFKGDFKEAANKFMNKVVPEGSRVATIEKQNQAIMDVLDGKPDPTNAIEQTTKQTLTALQTKGTNSDNLNYTFDPESRTFGFTNKDSNDRFRVENPNYNTMPNEEKWKNVSYEMPNGEFAQHSLNSKGQHIFASPDGGQSWLYSQGKLTEQPSTVALANSNDPRANPAGASSQIQPMSLMNKTGPVGKTSPKSNPTNVTGSPVSLHLDNGSVATYNANLSKTAAHPVYSYGQFNYEYNIPAGQYFETTTRTFWHRSTDPTGKPVVLSGPPPPRNFVSQSACSALGPRSGTCKSN